MTISTYLSEFPQSREERMRAVMRYRLFEQMHHRSSLWLHAKRVAWVTEELAKLVPADASRAVALALVHDDAELMTGDIPAGHKAQMTQEQRDALHRKEEEANTALAAEFPVSVGGFAYADLLEEVQRKDTLEAQLASYADKLDGYCESLHELLGGNLTITTSVVFYANYFAQVRERLPLLAPALEAAHSKSPLVFPFIHSPEDGSRINPESYSRFSSERHTKTTVSSPTTYFPFYDAWKEVLLRQDDPEVEEWLVGSGNPNA